MTASPGIVAHLIVGPHHEPYLGAVLEAISTVAAHAVVNDNSGSDPGPNDNVLLASAFAANGRLTLIRSTFAGFAPARNACIEATPHQYRDGWVLFVDADEVHGSDLPRIASLLPGLPADVDAVDGYSRHFIGSFRWWRSVERRLCFFRYHPQRRWNGRVHEQLSPIVRRLAVPAVWSHYGHVVPPRMEWEKSRLYSSLGQPGFSPTDQDLLAASAERVWGHMRADVMPYRGLHPSAAAATIGRLAQEWCATFAEVDAMFSRCSVMERVRRSVRRINYERLLAFRNIAAGRQWAQAATV